MGTGLSSLRGAALTGVIQDSDLLKNWFLFSCCFYFNEYNSIPLHHHQDVYVLYSHSFDLIKQD